MDMNSSARAGSPDSLDSAPMDESDSDAEPSRSRGAASDDNKYPVDGLYTSEKEKAEIMAMREMEREQILADRAMEIERQRQNRLLRQMVADDDKDPHKGKRRTADADLDDSPRKTSRQRTARAGESAMETLRRKRAEKQKRRENNEHHRGAYSSDREESEQEDSDDDYGRRRSRTPEKEEPKEKAPAELPDYDRVRLGRNEFAQVCFTPGFESSITGCFIRIALGPHPETGVEQYRMAVIKGFTESRPYAINGPNGSFVTDQYIKAAHGKAIKEFPFIATSSSKFTDAELNRYTVTCHNEGVKLPTKDHLLSKIDSINNLINHKWTSEEIKARLARKNDFRRRFDPGEREKVARLLEEATVAEDGDKMEELQAELDKLGTQRLAFKTSLGPSKVYDGTKVSTEQERLAERNRENRRKNQEAVRKAQLKERAKAREIEAAVQRGEAVKEDMSRRLRTKAKFVHDVNESDASKAGIDSGRATPSSTGTPTLGATKPTSLLHLAKKHEVDSKGMPTIHKPIMDDDVIGSLDLDIDVEI